MSRTTLEIPTNKIARAAVWTSGSIALVRIFFLISSIITARLLNSEDFGLIGIAGAVYLLIDTSSASGIGSYLIFKQNLSYQERNTAFSLNSLIAVLFGFLVIVAGLLISGFYHRPQIRDILFFAGLGFFFSTLGGIPRACMIKKMKQDVLAVIDTCVNFLNLSLILIFAFLGYKHLSYVIPLMIYQIVCTSVLYIFAEEAFRLNLDKRVVKEIFKYSRNFAPQTLLADILYQVDYLVGSVFLTSAMMGFYYFGFEKAFLMSIFTRGISEQVLFPVFSKFQEDPTLLKTQYFKLSGCFMFLLFPIMLSVIFLAKDLMLLIYGNHWNHSIFTFQCILGFCILKVNYDISVTLFNAIGKSKQNLRHFLCVLPHTLLFFWIGASRGGITGLAISTCLAHSLSALLMASRLKKYFGWSFKEQGLHVIKYLTPALLVIPFMFSFKYLFALLKIHPLLSMLNLGILFFCFYLFFTKLLNPDILNQMIGFLNQKLRAKSNHSEILPET